MKYNFTKDNLLQFNTLLESLAKLAKFKQDSDYLPFFTAYEIKGESNDLSVLFSLEFKEPIKVRLEHVDLDVIGKELLSYFEFIKDKGSNLSGLDYKILIDSIKLKFIEFFKLYEGTWSQVVGVNCDCGLSTVSKVFASEYIEEIGGYLILDLGYCD